MNKIFVLPIIFLISFGCISQSATEETEKSQEIVKIEETQPTQDRINNSEMLADNGIYEIETSDVNYFENTMGYMAKPKSQGNYPAVILIHEWWGLNDNIKDMADQLASKGYVALAVDLYDGKVAKTPDEARVLVSSINQEKAIENMRSAIAYVRTNENADRIASLGWCFGGGQSMQLALSGENLDATIVYYGNVVSDEAKLQLVKWPVLGIFGEKDTSIKVENVREFDSKLDKLGIENEVYIYPEVGHAFANPSGMNYAPEETKDAWKKTLDFLEKNLKQ